MKSQLLSAMVFYAALPNCLSFAQTGSNQLPVGNGVVDDTAAIQAAVDAPVGSLRFSRGVFKLTKPIVIDLDRVGWTSIHGDGVARFEMHGPGPAFRFVGTHEGTENPSTVKPNVWQRQSTPMIDGIEITGKHPEADGIEADGTMQLTITRVVVRKARHAIRLTGRNRNVIIGQCHLYENSGIGVFLDQLNLHQINIANCHISYNQGGGLVSRESEIRNLQIGTCDIEGNHGGEGMPPTANVLLDSSDASVAEVAIVGCTIQHTHEGDQSANIRIMGIPEPRSFTTATRVGNVTIANNVLSDAQFNIDLAHVRGIAITGNTMWKGYEANLKADDCREIVLTGNVYDRNPRYHYGDGSDAKLGVILERCQNLTLNGETFQGLVHRDAVVSLKDCESTAIRGCQFSGFEGAAMRLEAMRFSSISDCLISGIGDESTDIIQVGENDVQLANNRFRRVRSTPNDAR
ncbi:MAG: right-handed parallel beta-helix repeat-containing protein [Planctomycetota bacterium]